MDSLRKLRSRLPQRSKSSASSSTARLEESFEGEVQSGSSTPKAHSSGRPKGLIVLTDFADADDQSSKADIIALHGLNGHALNTWKDGDTIWFRDLLPSLVPSASLRICTYGYSSEIVTSGVKGQMLDFVFGLLSALETLRRSTETTKVPMLFICHSLGGILFKKCLLMANERKELYGSIIESIRGVAFFGTPHRGSGCASLSKICLDIGHVFYPNLRSDLVQTLQRTATELSDINCSVPELLRPLSIVTAYETRPLELFKIAGIIVGRETALLNVTNEMAIPIDADHRSLCRFSDPASPLFRPVLLAIAGAVSKVTGTDTSSYQEFLDALYFDEFQERRLLLPDSYAGTFTWIWSHESFEDWIGGGSKMLWIQGKPASGKSTMMKFIREGLERQCRGRGGVQLPMKRRKNLGKEINPESIVVDFFYSVRGSNLQQEHVWMLRSILWQILRQIPSLWAKVVLSLRKQSELPGLKAHSGRKRSTLPTSWPQWISVENLQRVLEIIGMQDEDHTKLTIYVLVDAMDESKILNRRKIATSLLRLASLPEQNIIKFKILVASRPDPTTDVVSDRCIRMVFEALTDDDIKIFVERSLESLAEQVPSLQDGDLSIIQQTLQVKSQGVFLWVKLILLEFEEKFHNEGCTIREMEDILISIPPGLDSLYEWMFLTISLQTTNQRRETDSMLSWTALGPTSHEMMNDIVAIAACGESQLTTSTLKKNRLSSDGDIEKRVSTRCVNFLEWISSQDSLPVCQFIHTTAQHFITAKLDSMAQLVECQALKYAQFLVRFDPGWLSLTDCWPDFQVEQLKSINLNAVVEIFDTLTAPVFWYMLKRAEGKHLRRSLRQLSAEDISIVVPSTALSWKLCISLSLAAAVQANHTAFCTLGRYTKSAMLEEYCFGTSLSPGQGYTSFSIRYSKDWFREGSRDNPSSCYQECTMFCDLMSILAMFSGLRNLDQIAGTAKSQDWYSPAPGDRSDLFWFLSAARQGNCALAALYFKESREGNSRTPFIRDWAGSNYERLDEGLSNIISVAIDFDQLAFALMMIEEGYLYDMDYLDTPDKEGKTALCRACERNLPGIVKGIYSRYIDRSGTDETKESIRVLREQAREHGFTEIVGILEGG